MWHKTLWAFNARDCSGFSFTGRKVPAFTPLVGLCIQKNVSSVQKQNDEIRNQRIRNKTMKLPLVNTGVAAQKLTENDRLKVLTATVIVIE